MPAPFLSPAPPGSGFLFPVAGSEREHLGSETSAADEAMPGLRGPTSHSSDHHSLTRFLTGSLVCGSIALLSYIFSVCFLDQIYTRFQTALHSHINNENVGYPVFGIACPEEVRRDKHGGLCSWEVWSPSSLNLSLLI